MTSTVLPSGMNLADLGVDPDDDVPPPEISSPNRGSVNMANRGLVWGEFQEVYPGVIADSDLVLGAYYYSRLSFDGVGSIGHNWVHSLYERVLENPNGTLRHVHWQQPFNDPDLYFQETSPGSGEFVAPAQLGARITVHPKGKITRYTLTFKDGRVHTFDELGRITARHDVGGNPYASPPILGNATTFDYQATGFTVTDSRGQVFGVTTSAQGYITDVEDPLGNVISYEQDVNGFLDEVVFPVMDVYEKQGGGGMLWLLTKAKAARATRRSFTYNGNGRLSAVLNDANLQVMGVAYEPTDPTKVLTQTDANGGLFVFSEPDPTTMSVINPRGFKREYKRDADNHVIEVKIYEANFTGGAPARTTDTNLNYTWQIHRMSGCGGCGVPDWITEPDGGQTKILYDAAFNIMTLTLCPKTGDNSPPPGVELHL